MIAIRSLLRLGVGALALAGLSACVVAPPYGYYGGYPAQPQAAYPYAAAQAPDVEYGRVVDIEVIQTRAGGGTSGGGAVAGGAVGGVIGNQFGHGSGRAGATALGIIGGALIGNAIEANNNAARIVEVYRISVQTENGDYRAFDVPNPGDLRVGDSVRIENGQLSRY